MNILITGGTGFIGSHLVHRLLKQNHKVFILKRKTSDTWRIKSVLNQLKIINIEDLKSLDEIFNSNSIDIIIHLATKYVKNEKNSKDLSEMLEGNIVFPSLLLNTATSHNVKYFINTGTCYEYKFSDKPISEKTKLSPYNFYASTKIAFEKILKYQSQKNNLRSLTLKLFYPYGEKDNPKLITNLIKSILSKNEITLNKTEQQLSFTYIDDIINAYIKAVGWLVSKNKSQYQSFNIGSNKTHSVKSVVNTLEKISGKKTAINYIGRSDGINHVACDSSKALRILNWKTKFNLEKGLSKTFNYYFTNQFNVKK